MHVPFVSILLLFTAVLQLAEVVATDEQNDRYQLFRGLRKRIRPALGRRQKNKGSEERFLSTAFLHRVIDLKGTTTTTTCKPTGTTPTGTTPTGPTPTGPTPTSMSPSITGPTTISSFAPPLTAPETVATSTSPPNSARALNTAEEAAGTKHIRKSEEDEDEDDDDFIPYTVANAADFAALGEIQRTQHRRRVKTHLKQQKRQIKQKKLVKRIVKDLEL